MDSAVNQDIDKLASAVFRLYRIGPNVLRAAEQLPLGPFASEELAAEAVARALYGELKGKPRQLSWFAIKAAMYPDCSPELRGGHYLSPYFEEALEAIRDKVHEFSTVKLEAMEEPPVVALAPAAASAPVEPSPVPELAEAPVPAAEGAAAEEQEEDRRSYFFSSPGLEEDDAMDAEPDEDVPAPVVAAAPVVFPMLGMAPCTFCGVFTTRLWIPARQRRALGHTNARCTNCAAADTTRHYTLLNRYADGGAHKTKMAL